MQNDLAIDEFWEWFSLHSDRLRSVEGNANKESLLDEIMHRLHAIDAGLYLEVSKPHGGVNDLVVTAEGMRALFPLVDAVIGRAPKLAGWKFTALRSPMGFGFGLKMGPIRLNPDEIWFLPLTVGAQQKHFGVRLAVDDIVSANAPGAANAAWILLDTVLGERRIAETIEHVEVEVLPDHARELGYFRLSELEEYLALRDSQRGA